MVKNYNENAFNELVNTINKHIDGDSSALPVLVDMITELDKKYPMYDFKNNKGYPTKKHLEAIEKYGILKSHRRSYSPVANYLNNCKEN